MVEHTAKMLDKTIVVIEQDNEHTMGSAVESITLGYMRDAQHYVSITVVKVPETNTYSWPKLEDICLITRTDILGILPKPTILPGRGIRMSFDNEVLERCKKSV